MNKLTSSTFIRCAAGLPKVALLFTGYAEQERPSEQSVRAITETDEEVSQ